MDSSLAPTNSPLSLSLPHSAIAVSTIAGTIFGFCVRPYILHPRVIPIHINWMRVEWSLLIDQVATNHIVGVVPRHDIAMHRVVANNLSRRYVTSRIEGDLSNGRNALSHILYRHH